MRQEKNKTHQDQDIGQLEKGMAKLKLDSEISPQVPLVQTRRKKRSQKAIDKIIVAKKATNYYWNGVQNKRYITFLQHNAHLFQLSDQERRIQKINLQMSKKVRTRNPTQCHTHHQKMMKKYGSIPEIIGNLQIPQGTPEENAEVSLNDEPDLMLEYIPLHEPIIPPLPAIQVPILADQKEQVYRFQISPYMLGSIGESFIMGRFQDLEQEQLNNWVAEQEYLKWLEQ